MSSCDEIRSLLGRYVDRELDPGDVNRVDNHLSVCDRCAESVRLLEREAELLAEALSEEEPAGEFGQGLWQTLRARQRRRLYWWSGGLAAAAACLLAAILVTHWTRPGPARPEVARVIECAGPLELRAPRGSWTPLATYTVLRDGDELRCAADRPGRVTLNSNRRIDLDAGAHLAIFTNGAYGHFKLALERGRIRGDLPGLRREVSISTPVADLLVMPEESKTAGRAVFEVRLLGVPEQIGWLDRIHILPAAYAAPESPSLEIIVHEGSVLLFNLSHSGTAVTAGRRLIAPATGPLPEPVRFDARSLRRWWLETEPALARAPAYDPLPLPAEPRELKPSVTPRVEPVKDERIFEPPKGKEPAPAEPVVEHPAPADAPPAPDTVTAHPALDAVLLQWKPVLSEGHAIVEYGVYRRAPGDTEFILVGRVPTWGRSENTYRFLDEIPGMGIEYEYAAAAAWRDDKDKLVEGKMSAPTLGSPADFRLHFTGVGTGRDGDVLVNIVVEKLFDGALRRQSFQVQKLDAARGRTGLIGGPKSITLEPLRGARYTRVVDFSTGYRLVDVILPPEDELVIPKKRPKIVVEDDLGIRREIDQAGGP